MGLFSSKKDSNAEAMASSRVSSEAAAALQEAKQFSAGSKKRKSTTGEESSTRLDLPPAMAEKLASLFKPEAWEPIVRAPFLVGKAATGRKCWELQEKEAETLSVSTAMTAEYFWQHDPKWLALTICSFNWLFIVSQKLVEQQREIEYEKLARMQAEKGSTQ